MVENPFYAFVSLVELDQAIDQKIAQREKLIIPLQKAKERIEVQEQVTRTCKEQLQQLRKKIAALDLEHKSLQQQEKKRRDKLNAVNTAKEYAALEQELQTTLKAEELKEEEIFALWSEFEAHEARCKHEDEQNRQVHEKAEKEITQIQEEQVKLQEEIAQLTDQRPAVMQAAPEEFVAKYFSMRQSIKNPVVCVIENGCSGCATQLMNADLLQLRRHVILPCKTCYRLLYMK